MYNFKRKSDAQHAVDAARERALGVVRSARVQFAPRRVSGGDEASGVGIYYAQAPPGGVSSRFNFGSSTLDTQASKKCRLLEAATENGPDYVEGQLVLTREIVIVNPFLQIAGAEGDRIMQISGDQDGAQIIGWSSPNELSDFFPEMV